MPDYDVVVVNEDRRPTAGVSVEAVSLNSWPTVSSVQTTGRNGAATFTGLTGPHFFRPRLRRTSATVGGHVYTGALEVQVVRYSEGSACTWDYVVDPAGGGTHTTLAAAVAAAITAAGVSGERTIWVCSSVTEGAIDIGGMGTGATITIASHSSYSVVITATANNDIFIQTTNGGNITGALRFQNIGLAPNGSNAVFRISTGSELATLAFDHCTFYDASNTSIVRQTGAFSMGSLSLILRDCDGGIDWLYQVTAAAAATYAPDAIRAFDCILALTAWWNGGTGNAAPDFLYIYGGEYSMSAGITFPNGADDLHWSSLRIAFSGSTPIFTSAAASQSIVRISWRDLLITFTNQNGVFLDLGSNNINPLNDIFIDTIHAYQVSSLAMNNTFITIDADATNIHAGNIHAPNFSSLYTGPTGRTGHIRIPAAALNTIVGAPTLVTIASRWAAWDFVNGATDGVGGGVPVPEDYSNGAMTVKLHWTRSSAVGGGGGNVAWRTIISGIVDAATLAVSDSEVLNAVTEPAQNVLDVYTTTNAFTPAAADEFLGIRVGRDGADASDTSTESAALLAVEVEYRAWD